jgi:hypothetical protein
MKYRAKVDIPPNVKAGDIVEANDELVPAFKSLLEKVGDDEELTDLSDNDDGVIIANPSRDELKARATELEITFAPNIPTDRLIELIKEAEAKKDAE